MSRTWLYAHRGASREFPENTLPAFQRAVDYGVDVLETDLQLTRDGVIVVHHDHHGRRMANQPARVAELTYDQLQRWDVGWGFRRDQVRVFANQGFSVPRFDALLDRFPQMRFNVDMKSRNPALPSALHRLLRDRAAVDRVQVASFHHRQLQRLIADGFCGVTSLSRDEVLALLLWPARRMPPLGNRNRRAQLPAKLGPWSLVTPRLLDRCRQLKLAVDLFTVNDVAQANALVRLGVDGIMTDDPKLLAPVVCGLADL